jgi:hypothetical protein
MRRSGTLQDSRAWHWVEVPMLHCGLPTPPVAIGPVSSITQLEYAARIALEVGDQGRIAVQQWSSSGPAVETKV